MSTYHGLGSMHQDSHYEFTHHLLPMFLENVHSVAMIQHSMNIIKSAVHHVNPGQVPVITFDQPLFEIAKQIQWSEPALYGGKQFVIMLGGFRAEMAAFKVLGIWLDGSGWTSVIVDSGVSSASVAESFIKTSHLTRTGRAHQITAASLHILKHNALRKYQAVTVELLGFTEQGPVVQKPVNANLGLKVNQGFWFSC